LLELQTNKNSIKPIKMENKEMITIGLGIILLLTLVAIVSKMEDN
jgi:hypothetical protein